MSSRRIIVIDSSFYTCLSHRDLWNFVVSIKEFQLMGKLFGTQRVSLGLPVSNNSSVHHQDSANMRCRETLKALSSF